MPENTEKKTDAVPESCEETPEEPKGARYIVGPVRLADLPRLAGRKPIDPSKRLFLKLTFVALAAPGSFAVMPSRAMGAHPGCGELIPDICLEEPPGTGSCNQPETDMCTQDASPTCSLANPNTKYHCTAAQQNKNRNCTAVYKNVCEAQANANTCGIQAGTQNTCTDPGANECRDQYQANVCGHINSNVCTSSTGVSNSCGTDGESINTCNDSGANTCGTGSTAPNSCQPEFGGNVSTP